MTALLEINDLVVSVEEKEILKGIDLTIQPGEVHVVMGPNGAGKSTLLNAIMAHPKYQIDKGDIRFKEVSILDDSTDERARKGIFLSFQSPQEIPGVTVEDFLRTAKSEATKKNVPVLKFKKDLAKKMENLEMKSNVGERYLNVGFSGGEKKKNEILQMQVLDPDLILLDETDSGLDVDAVRVVSEGISDFLNEDKACLIITHHSAILDKIKPNFVHIIIDGRIVKEGGPELIDRVQQDGYAWVRQEMEERANNLSEEAVDA